MMLRPAVLLAIVVSVFSNASAQHTWHALDGPNGGSFTSVIASPNGTFYVTEWVMPDHRLLLRSTDRGDSWTDVSGLPDAYARYQPQIYSYGSATTLFSCTGDNVLVLWFAGTASNGAVSVSSDGGNTWKLLADSLNWYCGAGRPGEFFVVRNKGVLRTADAGSTWTNVTSLKQAAAIFHLVGDIYYATGTQFGNAMSYDNCKTFVPNAYFGLNSQVVLPLPGGQYYSIGNNMLKVGDLFNPLSASIDIPWMLSVGNLENIGNAGNTIVGLETNGSCYSAQCAKPYLFFLDPRTKRMIAADTMPPFAYRYPSLGSVGSGQANQLIAGDTLGTLVYTNGEALYRTTDGAKTWTEMPIHNSDVDYLTTDIEGRIFAKASEYGNPTWLQMSENGGQTWRRISPIGYPYFGMVGPGYDGGVITTVHDSNCGSGMDIWYYGGIEVADWKKLSRLVYPPPGSYGGGPPTGVFTFVDSSDDLFLSGDDEVNSGGLLYESNDKGMNWDALVSTPPTDAQRYAHSPSWNIYVGGTGNHLSMSPDGGQTWRLLTRLPVAPDVRVSAICAPTDNILFVASAQYGIWRSSDAGKTWSSFTGPWGDSINCLAALSDGTLFIGTQGRGLFSCSLAGANIVKEPISLISDVVLTLFVDKYNKLFVGAQSSPIWVIEQASSVATNTNSTGFGAQVVVRSDGSQALRVTNDREAVVRIELFDALGRQLESVPSEVFTAGVHMLPLPLDGRAAGAYFVRVSTPTDTRVVHFIH